MAKAMKYRQITKALRTSGCIAKQGRGDHEKWFCPCGSHMAVITQTREVSPGVVHDVVKKMQCLPKGWLK